MPSTCLFDIWQVDIIFWQVDIIIWQVDIINKVFSNNYVDLSPLLYFYRRSDSGFRTSSGETRWTCSKRINATQRHQPYSYLNIKFEQNSYQLLRLLQTENINALRRLRYVRFSILNFRAISCVVLYSLAVSYNNFTIRKDEWRESFSLIPFCVS